ncbi:MAG: hypothetical protein E7286_11100 [Lachnospiraceae bacterium]|nr:hypothetical protein [Lachnospiraceae bacterium]
MTRENYLTVRMFGRFEIIYNNQMLNLGHSQTTKAMKLLQLLLFYGNEGIHRSQIIQYLFGVDAEGELQANLRVVVHNLRRILERSGLPEHNYISIEAGIYRFTPECSWSVDARRFEDLIRAAKSAEGENKYELLQEACNLYKGHFLPELAGDDWVIMRDAHFRSLYTESLTLLAEMMKKRGMYQELYILCNHASSLFPFDEWQVYVMDALVAMGDAKAAMELYDATTTMYFKELSMPPSDKMMECFRRMRERLQMRTSNISEVQGELDEKEFLKGAFFCQYPSFADNYRVQSRMMERSGHSVYLLMCTIKDEAGQVLDESEWVKSISDNLFLAIQESLRRGDVFTKYNLKQYLVMLMGIRREECSIVTERIDKNFRKRCPLKNVRIHYYISSVAADYRNIK